jgi:hypothetical protein
VSTTRHADVTRGKSLAELILSGGYRADRHWELVLKSSRPEGIEEHIWRDIVSQAKAYLRRKMGDERREAEKLLAFQLDLTPDEDAAYEEMISAPNLTDDMRTRLRNRSQVEKRTDVIVGRLHPLVLWDIMHPEDMAPTAVD